MADLTFQVMPIEGIARTARVAMSGAIDASTVVTFQARLEKLKADGTRRFLLDMEGIRYVNSTGLGSLVKLADQLENEGGSIVLMKIHPKVKVVFDMLGLNAFFRIFNSDDEAMSHLKSLPPIGGPKAAEPAPAPAPAARPAPAPAARPAPVAHAAAPPHAAPAPVAAESQAGAIASGGFRVALDDGRGGVVNLLVPSAGNYRCPRTLIPFRVGADGKVSPIPERGSAPLHLTVNGSDSCVEGLRQFVGTVAKGSGLSGDTARQVEASVREVVDTIVSGAYENDRQRPFSVFIAVGSGEIGLTFTDTGRTLNGGNFSGTKAKMDRFDLRAHPLGGNIVSMSKRG